MPRLAAVLADQLADPDLLREVLDELHRRGQLPPAIVALAHARHLAPTRAARGNHQWRSAEAGDLPSRFGLSRCCRCGRWRGRGAHWLASASQEEAIAVLESGAGAPDAGGCPGREGEP